MKIIKVKTDLITDPDDAMYGKYIHQITYQGGGETLFSSDVPDIKEHLDADKLMKGWLKDMGLIN